MSRMNYCVSRAIDCRVALNNGTDSLEHDQSKGGFTGLVLSIAAMVSTTTGEVIQKALQTVPTKRVLAWCKETLGQSVQSKRRKAFARPKETEQKRDQFKAAG